MIEEYRPFAEKILDKIAKQLGDTNPDIFSWLALIFAFLTGYSFYAGTPKMLLLASILVALSAFCDAMDGALARFSRKASLKGDFLDHILDRYADIFIIGGIMLSPYARDFVGFLAIIGVLLTSYMGTQAQAILGKRDYSGYLGRATRLLILIFAPLIQYAMLLYPAVLPYNLTALDFVMFYFAIVGNITAIQRAFNTWRWI